MVAVPETPRPTPRIVAVVVTFNRLTLLQRLLGELRRTPGLAEVVVVDNASTDGTSAWLAEQADVHGLTLGENLGGAGGFHEGLRIALERGADRAWLMDDDGMPVDGCLARLLEHDGEFDFWGPVVVDEDDPDTLVFPAARRHPRRAPDGRCHRCRGRGCHP